MADPPSAQPQVICWAASSPVSPRRPPVCSSDFPPGTTSSTAGSCRAHTAAFEPTDNLVRWWQSRGGRTACHKPWRRAAVKQPVDHGAGAGGGCWFKSQWHHEEFFSTARNPLPSLHFKHWHAHPPLEDEQWPTRKSGVEQHHRGCQCAFNQSGRCAATRTALLARARCTKGLNRGVMSAVGSSRTP